MSDDGKSSPLESLKAAAKARLLEEFEEKFERDWADAKRLATAYPDLFAIVPRSMPAPQSAAPKAAVIEPTPLPASPESQKNEQQQGFDGSVKSLVHCYRTDERSPYKRIRYRTRVSYDLLLRRVSGDLGLEHVKNLDTECIDRWHKKWSAGGKVAMGHSMMSMMRALASFGAKFLKDQACREFRMTLHDMKFDVPPSRNEQLTAEHAIAIRAQAHKMGMPSIALAQALQFELRLRQRDVIGEWVPVSEAPFSDVLWSNKNKKWIRGLKWNEIDHNLVLRHPTLARKGGVLAIDLRTKRMVREELGTTDRVSLPASGPMIVAEYNGYPYEGSEFRRQWRKVADAAGVPKNVFNMDSRARERAPKNEAPTGEPGAPRSAG
jgi:hypothetical protein